MITLTWLNAEKTILQMQFGASWTASDFNGACDTAQLLIRSVSHPVDVIADLSLSKKSPPNLIAIVRKRMKFPKCYRNIVVIRQSHLWERLYQYMMRVYPQDIPAVDFVQSRYEALQILGVNQYNQSTC